MSSQAYLLDVGVPDWTLLLHRIIGHQCPALPPISQIHRCWHDDRESQSLSIRHYLQHELIQVHYGAKPDRFETSNHSLSHERGSERS